MWSFLCRQRSRYSIFIHKMRRRWRQWRRSHRYSHLVLLLTESSLSFQLVFCLCKSNCPNVKCRHFHTFLEWVVAHISMAKRLDLWSIHNATDTVSPPTDANIQSAWICVPYHFLAFAIQTAKSRCIYSHRRYIHDRAHTEWERKNWKTKFVLRNGSECIANCNYFVVVFAFFFLRSII